ncbi:MAG: type II toxin-antitoxin system HicA family toxin [Desulfosalsimonadaceae bacterium]
MGTLPVLKSKDIIAMLTNLGFKEVRQRGSHKQFRHQDGRGTTVPVHSGRDISPILLKQILKDIGITTEEFLKNK